MLLIQPAKNPVTGSFKFVEFVIGARHFEGIIVGLGIPLINVAWVYLEGLSEANAVDTIHLSRA
jgi:hypothetical protein